MIAHRSSQYTSRWSLKYSLKCSIDASSKQPDIELTVGLVLKALITFCRILCVVDEVTQFEGCRCFRRSRIWSQSIDFSWIFNIRCSVKYLRIMSYLQDDRRLDDRHNFRRKVTSSSVDSFELLSKYWMISRNQIQFACKIRLNGLNLSHLFPAPWSSCLQCDRLLNNFIVKESIDLGLKLKSLIVY